MALKHALPALLLLALPALADPPPPLPEGAAAVVNGEAIPLAELQQLLQKRHGPELLRELVLKRIIQQEARRTGVEVDEADIQAHLAEVRADLKRQMAADVSLEQVLKSQGVSETDFREQVAVHLALKKLAVRDALCGAWVRPRILVASTEEKAQALLAQLKGGADFGALARKESTDASAAHEGDLGARFRGEIPPELEPTAFSIKVGDLSGVVRTPLGFVVLKVEERQEASARPWAEIRDEVSRRLAKDPPGQEMMDRLLGRLRRAASVQVLASIPLEPPAP